LPLDIGAVSAAMLAAARTSLGKDYPKVQDYAKSEFGKLAQTLSDITEMALAGKISPQEAQSLVRVHANTVQIVLLTVEGMGLIAVESAINAALGAARAGVNTTIGFALI
jgi:hypothetical protein